MSDVRDPYENLPEITDLVPPGTVEYREVFVANLQGLRILGEEGWTPVCLRWTPSQPGEPHSKVGEHLLRMDLPPAGYSGLLMRVRE